MSTRRTKWAGLLQPVLFVVASMLCFYAGIALGDAPTTTGGIGDVATKVTGSFQSVGQLILATAYLAGIGFAVAAIFKFKQHKDNPTQIPLGTPIALLVIGAALIFLPNFLMPLGKTMFETPTAAGFTGGGAPLPGGGGGGGGQ